MALIRFIKSIKQRNPELFDLMVKEYGAPVLLLDKNDEEIYFFNIPGAEINLFYDQYFSIDKNTGERTFSHFQLEDSERDSIQEIQALINEAISYGAEVGTISDGYHTFDELYAHRIALFKALCIQLMNGSSLINVWKSKLHSDGSHLEGWFVSGIGIDAGKQITYHVPLSEWDTWPGDEMNTAPEWDGHTSADVLKRLAKL